MALDGLAFDWIDWGSPPPAAPTRLQELNEQALRTRSDLAGAIDEYAAAETRLHQAVVRQYPQFQLSPGYYWDHGIAKFPFDVGFTLPLFNRSEGEIAEARAAREVAGQRMLALQAEIIGAVVAAERVEKVAQANVAAAERGFDAARRQRENAALSLRLGGITASEDTAAEILVLRSQLEVVQMRAQLQAARNALEDALHAPLSGPELDFATAFPVPTTGAAR
jgi:outer membrane protein TolC